ncbi:MAG: nucleotidyltransferase family protein [Anaerolineae bacterium]
MNPKITLVIMAAGMGSRYGGLKQLDPVGPHGELLIEYAVYDALRTGFDKVVFVIKPSIEADFRARIGRAVEARCETRYVYQRLDDLPRGFSVPPGRKKPWGTGHAALSCRHSVAEPCAILNADDFYGASAYRLLADHLRLAQDTETSYDYCMVGYKLKNTLSEHGYVSRGVCRVDAEGYLLDVRERTHIQRLDDAICYTEDGETWTALPEETLVSMNMWGFTPSLFGELETRFKAFLERERGRIDQAEFFLPNVVGDLIKEGRARVRVLTTDERWFGVTYHEDKAWVKDSIRARIEAGLYPARLWEEGS